MILTWNSFSVNCLNGDLYFVLYLQRLEPWNKSQQLLLRTGR